MAPTDTTAEREPRTPDDPADLLPQQSVLSFEEYLAMQQAIGEPTRFRILYQLAHNGPASAKELREALDLPGNALHHHLGKLVDVGVVENRKRSERDSDGLHSFYRATALGSGLLEHGVEELMRREQSFHEMYGE